MNSCFSSSPVVENPSQSESLSSFVFLEAVMTPYLTQSSLLGEKQEAVVSFCSTHKVPAENVFAAAWCYTLSVYTAASAVSTTLLHAGKELSVSGEFEGHSSILGVILGLKFADTCSNNDPEAPISTLTGLNVLDGGSSIQYGYEQTFDRACTSTNPGRIRLLVSDHGCITLQCMSVLVSLSLVRYLKVWVELSPCGR